MRSEGIFFVLKRERLAPAERSLGEFSGAHLHGVALGAAGDEKVNLSRWDRDISSTYDEAPAA